MGRTFSKLKKSAKTAGDSKVPKELVDEILDHLAGDMRTLRSCSLVAKSWISPSRRLLFSALLLDTDRILAWNKTFPSPENSPARHVRELTISFEQTTPIDFADRMPYFSNVQQLSLSGLLPTDPGFTSKALGQLPPTIRSVTFTLRKVLTVDLVSVIRQLLNLNDLSFYLVDLGGKFPVGLGKPIQSRLGGKLLLHGVSPIRNILDMLMEVQTGPRFVEVEIRETRMSNFSAALKLVGACQDTMTKFHFSAFLRGRSLFLACTKFSH